MPPPHINSSEGPLDDPYAAAKLHPTVMKDGLLGLLLVYDS